MSFSVTISLSPKLISAIHKFERSWDATSKPNSAGRAAEGETALSELESRFKRLEAVERDVQNDQDSVPNANARIGDPNYEIQTSRLAGQQILQQAGIHMPSQGTDPEQSILNLLS